jgi:hypothetical protein
MKINIYIILFMFFLAATSFSYENYQTDSEIFLKLFPDCIKEQIPEKYPLNGKTVYIDFQNSIELSKRSIETAGAVITSMGASVLPEKNHADYHLNIAVSDGNIVLLKDKNNSSRTFNLKIYLNFYEKGTLLYAGSAGKQFNDTIPNKIISRTNDSSLFSPEIKRISPENENKLMMTVSVAIITSALTYFAFQK